PTNQASTKLLVVPVLPAISLRFTVAALLPVPLVITSFNMESMSQALRASSERFTVKGLGVLALLLEPLSAVLALNSAFARSQSSFSSHSSGVGDTHNTVPSADSTRSIYQGAI